MCDCDKYEKLEADAEANAGFALRRIAELRRDLEASRMAHAKERELRQAAEAQRDRLIGLLHSMVERHGALERQTDRIIEMLGAKL